jgi:hypothetical protein
MATALSAFLPYVLPHAPGIPKIAARQEVLRAAIRFCNETRVWRAVMPAVTIVGGTASYAIPVPTGGQVVTIESAKFNGDRIDPVSLDALEAGYPDWQTETSAEVQRYVQLDPDNLILHPVPLSSLTGGLVITASFKPTRTATTLPDLLFNEYADAIAAGALGLILAAQGKPWSNPQLAGYYSNQFGMAIGSASIQAAKSFTRTPLRTSPYYK